MKNKLMIVVMCGLVMVLLWMKFISYLHLLEINTVSPQVSASIYDSQKDSFFVCEYERADTFFSFFHIKEAWIETVWKNKVKDGRKNKIKLGGLQFVLRAEPIHNYAFTDTSYMMTWELDVLNHGQLGLGNGNYVTSLQKIVGNELQIALRRREDYGLPYQIVGKFVLKQKQKCLL